MQDLLAQYERELIFLRRTCREFADSYPKVAGRLNMSGEVCEDPYIERLIQASAMIAARVSKRLDDDYPQFTEALLDVLFPHYLRPFPSCAIVRLDGSGPKNAEAKGVITVPRGALLEAPSAQGVNCKFKTVYDLRVLPIAVTQASFAPLIKTPGGVRLPSNVTSGLRIAIESRAANMPLAPLAIHCLRIFIDGDPSFCAALRDTLFRRAACAFVEADDGTWIALPQIPVLPVGFALDEALIPFDARSHSAYRVMAEYFAFPDKFNFFDLDVAAILSRLPAGCSKFTLHLAVTGLRPDFSVARLLRSLSPDNLLLSCSPVVNLFQQPGVPIAITHLAADYSVLAHPTHARAFEVYSIDSVKMLRQREDASVVTEFRPFYSLRHGESSTKKGHYWVLRRDEGLAIASPGHEKKMTLVDADFEPLDVEKTSLSIELTCTNRDLPTTLPYGQAGGDFVALPAANGNPIRFLRRPTPPYRFESGHGAHWRLISHLTLNHHSLAQEGLRAFREMLTLNDVTQSPISQRQIGGLVALSQAQTSVWRRSARGASLVHGIEVRMTLDEEAFVGSGMHLFVQVIDQFLGLYVQVGSFVELVIVSHQSGEELIRCKPRNGNLSPV